MAYLLSALAAPG